MQYKILVSFKGSPDGRYAVDYAAGDVVELTDSLAAVALAEKWAEPVAADEAPADEAPAEKPTRAKKSKGAEAE